MQEGETKGRGAGASCGIEGPRQRKLVSIFRVTQYAGQETEHRIKHKSAFHFWGRCSRTFHKGPQISVSENLAGTSLRRAAGHCPSALS